MKKNKGITLIALVVTIVVLLILAGTTIMTIFGENGIVSRAAEAAFRQEIGAVREKIDLYLIEDQIKAEQEISFKEINIEDTKNWKYTLKQEIIFRANIRIESSLLETNWVWILRCAYNESGTTTDTDIIFVGTDDKPIDGSELPSGYSIVGSFKNNQDMGIWVSKYQPSVN